LVMGMKSARSLETWLRENQPQPGRGSEPKLTGVATILDLRRLRDQGLSKRAVARRLGVNRDTVARYWDGPVDVSEGHRCQPKGRKIDPYVEFITKRLDRYPELSAQRLYQEIKLQGYDGSARSVRRFVQGIRPEKLREYRPFETMPGEQAQVDWGSFGTVVESGVKCKLYAFVFTLCWSRAMYVEFVTRLDKATFLACLHRAFCYCYVGGVPSEVLFDNAKTVVAERVGSLVRFNSDLLRMGLTYGFSPRACWTHDPESKGKVESAIKYLRQGFFYGLEYRDLADLNCRVLTWCSEVANARVHGTTGEVPQVRLMTEKSHLKPLPLECRMPYVMDQRRAGRTSLIRVDGNWYSVPARFARKTVHFRRYEDHLEISDDEQLSERIDLVAGKNRTVVKNEHYPVHLAGQKRAHPLEVKFCALAPEAHAYLRGLTASGVGDLRDQMQAIISLLSDHSGEELGRAMARAVEFGAFGYGVLKRILKRQKVAGGLPLVVPSGKRLDPAWDVRVERRDLSYYGWAEAAQ